jgi:hypothetical protein
MSEFFKILSTAALTVVVGLAIFVIQQFLLAPLNAEQLVIGKIGYALFYYAERYANPLLMNGAAAEDSKEYQRYDEARHEIKKCTSELAATSNAIRLRTIFSSCGLTPKKTHIEESIGLLTEISRSMFETKNGQRATIQRSCANADRVRLLLGLNSIGVK